MPNIKLDKSYDLREAIVDLMGNVNDIKNDITSGNFYDNHVLDKLDYVALVLHDMLDRVSPTDRPPVFYPEQGTVFIDDVTKPKSPCVVESKMLLSTPGDGWVCYYDRDEGMSDFPRWLSAVESGNIKVVWCPSMGVVQNNSDYLAFWGLK